MRSKRFLSHKETLELVHTSNIHWNNNFNSFIKTTSHFFWWFMQNLFEMVISREELLFFCKIILHFPSKLPHSFYLNVMTWMYITSQIYFASEIIFDDTIYWLIEFIAILLSIFHRWSLILFTFAFDVFEKYSYAVHFYYVNLMKSKL